MGRTMTKHGDYSVHMEWNPQKGADYLCKHIKKGRLKVGELHKLKDGTIAFWSQRKAEELVYAKKSWGFDKSLMTLLRCVGCNAVRVVLTNGDQWYISMDDFNTHKTDAHPTIRTMFFVDFLHFAFVPGEPEDIMKTLSVGKWR